MGIGLKIAAQEIHAEAEKLYFYGFKLQRYLESNAILRLENYLRASLCYELSALAMILLRSNKTAKMCRGDYLDDDGKLKTHHSWVEFEVPNEGWCVLDLAWFEPAIFKKDFYFQHCRNLIPKWSCSYSEFWNIKLTNAVYQAMSQSSTSYIFAELSVFGNPKANGYGFKKYCKKEQKLIYTDGTYMWPRRFSSGKVLSSRMIRDFVKNPKREQPKAKSIRLAYTDRRNFEQWAEGCKLFHFFKSPQA